MARVQCVIQRESKILMVKHQQNGQTWWCLPGGGLEPGESPEEGALRELREECMVDGKIIREICYSRYAMDDESHTFLVGIGEQIPQLGCDPEFLEGGQILVDIAWLSLAEIPERDRAFLWAAGLLGIPGYIEEIAIWGDDPSYPGTR